MTTTTAAPTPPTPGDAPAGSEPPLPGMLARAAVGGVFMGLANLVPGISGGTMLVAVGIYTAFIDAIADVTRLRLRPRSLLVLGAVAMCAVAAIGGLAGLISIALAEFRWGMYSLFIGLTLGGVPVLWRMARPLTPASYAGAVAGLALMLTLVVLQSQAREDAARAASAPMLFAAGVAGASAMILPGVSGAYVLLLLGQYETIIESIKDFLAAALAQDVPGAAEQLGVLVPVGLGVVAGIVAVSNVLKLVLHRYEKATLGVLLGLLVGAPAGLYPFKEGVPPRVGDTLGGQVVTEEALADIDPKDWPERIFDPTLGQALGAGALILLGVGITAGVSRLGSGTRRRAVS